ncbi:glycoside hydrolase family 16 protein [Melanomma pulvis-pyrius CBS 109.77]|uniref:endo-1,3(4)-beta-glucanase n=1 Tax=Melanomma pulvis-pyrius CBS 109.77 TaxID=1314802 RepID=A0A6A6XS01_9PLEO|nr:glycoside hydrolase family 16 protein [Melanomma pulvis-pyrius CBS 109.77]
MPSSSLFLSVGTILSALSSTVVATQYTLGDSYAGSTFLNGFDFFTAADPTNGFVKYLDKTTAQNAKIVKMVGTDNYLGVDYTTPLTVAGGVGRGSVRIESKKTYNKGLFLVDIKHMPGGICGTWPAFWSLGSGTWPSGGEIDIIEGVNQNTQNKMVLHTDTNCKTNGLGQSGSQSLYDCALDSASGASGCDVNAVAANTFGTGFNSAVGGVYAMEWTSTSIKMWFFPRNQIPASITANAPDTATFGTPTSNFEGACNMDTKFIDHKFIFDTTFCGDWAGNVYGDTSCPKYAGLGSMDACKKYVAENPAAFQNAFWQITSFKTFNKAAVQSSSSSTRASSSSTRISSTGTSTRPSSTLGTSTRSSTSTAATATNKVSTDATCGGTTKK